MLVIWSEIVEYDLEMFSITNFYWKGKNINNIGISISKHLVTFLIFFFYENNDVLPRRLSTYGELFLSWFGLYRSAVT